MKAISKILICVLLLAPLTTKADGIDTTTMGGWKPVNWSNNASYQAMFVDTSKAHGQTSLLINMSGYHNSWVEIGKIFNPPISTSGAMEYTFYRNLVDLQPELTSSLAQIILYVSENGINFHEIGIMDLNRAMIGGWIPLMHALPNISSISKVRIKFIIYFGYYRPDPMSMKLMIDYNYLSKWGLTFVRMVDDFEGLVNTVSNQNTIPEKFNLRQNYPNPFNPTTKIEFNIPKVSQTKLIVYDVLGKEVVTLVNERLNAGSYEVDWNASGYPSGVYFYKLQTDNFVDTKKMILMK